MKRTANGLPAYGPAHFETGDVPCLASAVRRSVAWAPGVPKSDTIDTFVLQKPRVTGLNTPFACRDQFYSLQMALSYPSETHASGCEIYVAFTAFRCV